MHSVDAKSVAGLYVGAVIDAWPPEPFGTDKILLRAPCVADRAGVAALLTTPAVRTYLGGVRSGEELQDAVGAILEAPTGTFSVEAEGAFAGLVTVDRRDPCRPSDPTLPSDVLELSYVLLPQFWGQGLAKAAASAALSWVSRIRPAEPVVVCTQAANGPSLRLAARLGFHHLTTFQEFGADQWLGVRCAYGAATDAQ